MFHVDNMFPGDIWRMMQVNYRCNLLEILDNVSKHHKASCGMLEELLCRVSTENFSPVSPQMFHVDNMFPGDIWSMMQVNYRCHLLEILDNVFKHHNASCHDAI